MNTYSIEAAPLLQGVGGVRVHPDLPQFEMGAHGQWAAWLQAQGLQVMRAWMEDDTRSSRLYEKFKAGDWAALSEWQPEKPNGDDSWFVLCIFCAEEGPCAYFARHWKCFNLRNAST